jgi:hypothetical protein
MRVARHIGRERGDREGQGAEESTTSTVEHCIGHGRGDREGEGAEESTISSCPSCSSRMMSATLR